MDFREKIRLMERINLDDMDRVPEWARAEHMERIVPLKELWKYPITLQIRRRRNKMQDVNSKKNIARGFRKIKRKHVMICRSAEEMNRKADALMEQGYQVERETGVLPIQTICFPIFMVMFWR